MEIIEKLVHDSIYGRWDRILQNSIKRRVIVDSKDYFQCSFCGYVDFNDLNCNTCLIDPLICNKEGYKKGKYDLFYEYSISVGYGFEDHYKNYDRGIKAIQDIIVMLKRMVLE